MFGGVHITRPGIFLCICTVIAGGLTVFSWNPVFAQEIQPSGIKEIQAILRERLHRNAAQQKLDSHIHLAGQVGQGVLSAKDMPSLKNVNKLLEFDAESRVHVDIQAAITSELLTQITDLCCTVDSSQLKYGAIRAWVALLEAEKLAKRPDVTSIKSAVKLIYNEGLGVSLM